MKFIYDEAKAIREKREIDRETPAKNRRAKKHNTILTVVLVLVVAAIFYGLFIATNYLLDGSDPALLGFGLVCASIFVLGIAVLIFVEVHKPIMSEEERYPASVKFYLATKDKKLLDSSIALYDSTPVLGDDYRICLTLEDENHIVSQESFMLTFFKTQSRTDISEEIVDLDNKIVSKPFKC